MRTWFYPASYYKLYGSQGSSTHLMQLWGSVLQSILQRNLSHASQPIGGVLISPFSRPVEKEVRARAKTETTRFMMGTDRMLKREKKILPPFNRRSISHMSSIFYTSVNCYTLFAHTFYLYSTTHSFRICGPFLTIMWSWGTQCWLRQESSTGTGRKEEVLEWGGSTSRQKWW